MLENVCWTSPNEVTVYSDSIITAAYHDVILSTVSLNEERDKKNEPIPRNPFTIKVVPVQEIPQWAFATLPAVVVGFSDNSNPGHVLGDMLWPAFRMLHKFSWHHKPYQLIMNCENNKCNNVNKDIYHRFVSTFTGSTYLLNPIPATEPFHPKCYKHMFIGSADLSYSEGSSEASIIQAFRHNLLHLSGFANHSVATHHYSAARHPSVAIIMKHVKEGNSQCAMGNIPQIETYLRGAFPDVQVMITPDPI
jgi:hypothetical protein